GGVGVRAYVSCRRASAPPPAGGRRRDGTRAGRNVRRVRERGVAARTRRGYAPGADGTPGSTGTRVPRRMPDGGGALLARLHEAGPGQSLRPPGRVRFPGDRRVVRV